MNVIPERIIFVSRGITVFIFVDSETVQSSMDRKYLFKLRNKRTNTKTLIFADGYVSDCVFMAVIPYRPTGGYQCYGE